MARGKAPARRPAPPAPAAKKAGKGRAPPVAVESSEDDASEDENFMSFDKQEEDSDVEKEAGVFDLKMKDSDDEDDSEEEDEESEEDSDDDEEDRYYEDDDDLNEEERDLQALVDNLPLEMRTKIRSGQAIDESEEEDEEEDPDDVARWGKKKAYYAGDTADLEIGQDMEDAIDEEEAAKELYQQKVKRMKKKDFYDDLDVAEDSNDDEAPKQKKKQTKDRVAKELEAIALGSSGDVGHGSDEVVLEKLAKDVSKMSKAQKLELIAENSPELLTIVSELRERVDELQSRITPVKALVQKLLTESEMPVDDDLVDYLEVKQQLLLSYCVNVTFYLYMKSLGKSVRNHPVMRQLLRLRYCMEKMQGLDGKLKYQIDRLAKVAESGEVSGELQASLLRPNLASLMEDDDEEANGAVSKKRSSKKSKHADSSEEEEDEEDEESEIEDDDDEDPRAARKAAASKDNIYRAPKLTSMPYPNEREEEKRDRKLEKHKQKLRTSELMAALTAEFGTAPEESASSGFGDNSGDLKRLEEEQKERIKFEEDHFIRTTMSRKDKKDIKRRTRDASRIDNFEDIGDFGDMEEISKLTSGADDSGKSKKKSLADASNPFLDASSSKALKRAAMEFGAKSNGKTPFDLIAAEFGNPEDHTGGRKRRRAPDSLDAELEDDGGENIFDDFVSKKKTFLDKKKEHYTAEPRFGGYEENVEDGQKRAASYEIIKNRGLTPHRKKENRNGRVKKRAAFEKATIARKGQVRDVITGAAASYGGEGTGIKAQVSRSRKM